MSLTSKNSLSKYNDKVSQVINKDLLRLNYCSFSICSLHSLQGRPRRDKIVITFIEENRIISLDDVVSARLLVVISAFGDHRGLAILIHISGILYYLTQY